MATKSTVKRRRRKLTDPPAKPYPEYPLRPHPSGHWAKKIGGKTIYFGAWSKRVNGKLITLPDGGNYSVAKARYDAEIDGIHADLKVGRKPRTGSANAVLADGLTVAELCNTFMISRLGQMNGSELAASTFSDYKSAASLLVNKFGGQRLVESLDPSDFESLRTTMAKTWGVHRRGKFVQLIRTIFKYGSDNGLVVKNVLFGSTFKRPGKKTMRKHKATSGKKMFAVEEIRLMLDALEGREVTVTKAGKETKIKLAANPSLRAMILLAVNGGLGNTDIGDLQFSNIKIDEGWVAYPRPKTGLPRRFPLWKETVGALKAHIAKRREAKRPGDAECIFLNRAGARMVQQHREDREEDGVLVDVKIWRQDYVSSQFRALLQSLHINHRKGLSFYALRHTFATIALQTGDRDCVKAIMGHAENDTLEDYDEIGPDDGRRIRVVEHVRKWLFGGTSPKSGRKKPR